MNIFNFSYDYYPANSSLWDINHRQGEENAEEIYGGVFGSCNDPGLCFFIPELSRITKFK